MDYDHIARSVKDYICREMETEMDDMLVYSQIFLTLTKEQQTAWVTKMEEKWNATQDKTLLVRRGEQSYYMPANRMRIYLDFEGAVVEFSLGWKNYVAWQHYKNLAEQNESAAQ
jgi:hypothetical protein